LQDGGVGGGGVPRVAPVAILIRPLRGGAGHLPEDPLIAKSCDERAQPVVP
jgi:hypothetical protein